MAKKDYIKIEQDDLQFNKFLHNFVIRHLRLATYKWPFKHMKKAKSKIEYGLYRCDQCKGAFGPKEIHLDHISPVVDTKGFVSWDEYIKRLFIKSDGFQVLCKPCHDSKTLVENELRKINKKKNRKKRVQKRR